VNGQGGDVSQWAGGELAFDAQPWNQALAGRAIGSAADPIQVQGGGGSDTLHVLGSPLAYSLSREAGGAVRLSEASGLGQNAVVTGVGALAFSDGTLVWLSDVGPAPYRVGGAGADLIQGPATAAYLRGAAGADTIVGGLGGDTINGNAGADLIQAGGGDDVALGGRDEDVLLGQDGNDDLNGNLGSDTVDGGAGADTVRGGQGDDVLIGGAGDDWLSGDRGDDTLTGGPGADTFHGFVGSGLDRVLDFDPAGGDRVHLDAGTAYSVAQSGADVVVSLGGADRLVLSGVQLSTLPTGWLVVA
jgi:Ca2+-binding RTX toxin-like protein